MLKFIEISYVQAFYSEKYECAIYLINQTFKMNFSYILCLDNLTLNVNSSKNKTFNLFMLKKSPFKYEKILTQNAKSYKN